MTRMVPTADASVGSPAGLKYQSELSHRKYWFFGLRAAVEVWNSLVLKRWFGHGVSWQSLHRHRRGRTRLMEVGGQARRWTNEVRRVSDARCRCHVRHVGYRRGAPTQEAEGAPASEVASDPVP